MNYGTYSRDLLLELQGDCLPPYNDSKVQSALQDLQLHMEALEDQANSVSGSTPSLAVRPSLLLHDAAIRRNKRCLLTYHWVRLQRMQKLLYSASNKNLSRTLSPAEQSFLHRYQSLHQDYLQNAGLTACYDSTTLHANLMPPTANDRVTVRVVKLPDVPDVVLDSGRDMVWVKGSTHSMLWSDANEWIRAGVLKVVRQEEEN